MTTDMHATGDIAYQSIKSDIKTHMFFMSSLLYLNLCTFFTEINANTKCKSLTEFCDMIQDKLYTSYTFVNTFPPMAYTDRQSLSYMDAAPALYTKTIMCSMYKKCIIKERYTLKIIIYVQIASEACDPMTMRAHANHRVSLLSVFFLIKKW